MSWQASNTDLSHKQASRQRLLLQLIGSELVTGRGDEQLIEVRSCLLYTSDAADD